MPAHEIDLAILLRSLDDDTFIAEALLYPEVSRLGSNPKSLERSVVDNALQILEKESLARVWSRLTPAEIETFELDLRLEPQKMSSWREPIDLRLDVVRWSLSESLHIAFIPVLGIEVISTKLSDLKPGNSKDSLLERHARAELQRRGFLVDFKALLQLQRTRELTLSRASATTNIRTPKQVMSATGQPEKKKSALEENTIDLVCQRLSPAFEIDERLAEFAVLTLCERRTLSKNLTLSYNNVIYQIKTKRAAYTMRGAHVEVREKSNGELTIEYKQRPLEYTIYGEQEQQQAKVVEAKLLQPAGARAPARPKQKRGPVPITHPWRLFDFTENSMLARERRGELCILRK